MPKFRRDYHHPRPLFTYNDLPGHLIILTIHANFDMTVQAHPKVSLVEMPMPSLDRSGVLQRKINLRLHFDDKMLTPPGVWSLTTVSDAKNQQTPIQNTNPGDPPQKKTRRATVMSCRRRVLRTMCFAVYVCIRLYVFLRVPVYLCLSLSISACFCVSLTSF